jgi:hypothetical protein
MRVVHDGGVEALHRSKFKYAHRHEDFKRGGEAEEFRALTSEKGNRGQIEAGTSTTELSVTSCKKLRPQRS